MTSSNTLKTELPSHLTSDFKNFFLYPNRAKRPAGEEFVRLIALSVAHFKTQLSGGNQNYGTSSSGSDSTVQTSLNSPNNYAKASLDHKNSLDAVRSSLENLLNRGQVRKILLEKRNNATNLRHFIDSSLSGLTSLLLYYHWCKRQCLSASDSDYIPDDPSLSTSYHFDRVVQNIRIWSHPQADKIDRKKGVAWKVISQENSLLSTITQKIGYDTNTQRNLINFQEVVDSITSQNMSLTDDQDSEFNSSRFFQPDEIRALLELPSSPRQWGADVFFALKLIDLFITHFLELLSEQSEIEKTHFVLVKGMRQLKIAITQTQTLSLALEQKFMKIDERRNQERIKAREAAVAAAKQGNTNETSDKNSSDASTVAGKGSGTVGTSNTKGQVPISQSSSESLQEVKGKPIDLACIGAELPKIVNGHPFIWSQLNNNMSDLKKTMAPLSKDLNSVFQASHKVHLTVSSLMRTYMTKLDAAQSKMVTTKKIKQSASHTGSYHDSSDQNDNYNICSDQNSNIDSDVEVDDHDIDNNMSLDHHLNHGNDDIMQDHHHLDSPSASETIELVPSCPPGIKLAKGVVSDGNLVPFATLKADAAYTLDVFLEPESKMLRNINRAKKDLFVVRDEVRKPQVPQVIVDAIEHLKANPVTKSIVDEQEKRQRILNAVQKSTDLKEVMKNHPPGKKPSEVARREYDALNQALASIGQKPGTAVPKLSTKECEKHGYLAERLKMYREGHIAIWEEAQKLLDRLAETHAYKYQKPKPKAQTILPREVSTNLTSHGSGSGFDRTNVCSIIQAVGARGLKELTDAVKSTDLKSDKKEDSRTKYTEEKQAPDGLHRIIWEYVIPNLNADVMLDKIDNIVSQLPAQKFDVPASATWKGRDSLLPMSYAYEGPGAIKPSPSADSPSDGPSAAVATGSGGQTVTSSDSNKIDTTNFNWRDGRNWMEKSDKEKALHFPPAFFLDLMMNINLMLRKLAPCITSRRYKKLFPSNMMQSCSGTSTNQVVLVGGNMPLNIYNPGLVATTLSQLPLIGSEFTNMNNLVPLFTRLPTSTGWSNDPEKFAIQVYSPEFQLWLLSLVAFFLFALEQDSGKRITKDNDGKPLNATAPDLTIRSIHNLQFRRAVTGSDGKTGSNDTGPGANKTGSSSTGMQGTASRSRGGPGNNNNNSSSDKGGVGDSNTVSSSDNSNNKEGGPNVAQRRLQAAQTGEPMEGTIDDNKMSCMYQMRISLLILETKSAVFRLIHQIDETLASNLHRWLMSEVFWNKWKRQAIMDPLASLLRTNQRMPRPIPRSLLSNESPVSSPTQSQMAMATASKRRKLNDGKPQYNIMEQDFGSMGKSVFGQSKTANVGTSGGIKGKTAGLPANLLNSTNLTSSAAAAERDRSSTTNLQSQNIVNLSDTNAKCDEFIQRFLQDETGESGIDEEEYLAKNDKVYSWQSRRLFSKAYLNMFFGQCRTKKSFLDLAFEAKGTSLEELQERRKELKQDEDEDADDEFAKYMAG